MWNVELQNDVGLEIAFASIDQEEITLDDIAELGWSLSDGDKIIILKENED